MLSFREPQLVSNLFTCSLAILTKPWLSRGRYACRELLCIHSCLGDTSWRGLEPKKKNAVYGARIAVALLMSTNVNECHSIATMVT